MNRSKWVVCSLLGLGLVHLSCDGRGSGPVVNDFVVDGEVDEEAIVSDIEGELKTLERGIEENDAELIFRLFSITKEATYVRDGKVEESIDDARESYARALSKLEGKRDFSFESKQFDIVDDDTVLFTGLGVIEAPEKEPWKLAYTILFSLEEDGFKALNMHISWGKP